MKKLRRWLSSTPSCAKVERLNVLTEERGTHQSHHFQLPAVHVTRKTQVQPQVFLCRRLAAKAVLVHTIPGAAQSPREGSRNSLREALPNSL